MNEKPDGYKFFRSVAPMPRLTHQPPPRELGVRVDMVDRMLLAVLVDRYGAEAMRRVLDDIEASRQARVSPDALDRLVDALNAPPESTPAEGEK